MIHKLSCLILFLCLISTQTVFGNDEVNIGFIFDGPWERNDEIKNIFQKEILELIQGEYDIQFPGELVEEADWTVEGIIKSLDSLYNNSNLDILVTVGFFSSHMDSCTLRLYRI